MTAEPTVEEKIVNELMIACPNCQAANRLSVCVKTFERNNGVTEQGLECPECGRWDHSFWMDETLQAKNERLQVIAHLYKNNPTPGRWTNYQTAKAAYNKDFDTFQEKMDRKAK